MRYGLFLSFLGLVCLSPAWALTAEQEAKLVPSDGAAEDLFGASVALDGDTALIGAVLDDDNGSESGSVYVFTRTSDVWTEQAKLLPSDGADGDSFGNAVALDGDTAVIGAAFDTDNGEDSGSAYVFTRIGGGWTEQAKLLPADGVASDHFGRAVALDGDTAVIGTFENSSLDPGSAYVFTRIGGVWTEQAKLLPSDGDVQDFFGAAVAVDGDTALIGAFHHDGNGFEAGATYVFTRAGGVWTEQAKLMPADGAEYDRFGNAVALEGDTALIGAIEDSDNSSGSGSAYVFTRTGGVWTERAKLLPADGDSEDYFGCDVALDGDAAVIGAYLDEDNGYHSGSAYVFARTDDEWTEEDKIMPSNVGPEAVFGGKVALYGETAVISARFDSPNGPHSGSAYVFRLLPDDDVPATSVVGLALLLLAVLGIGFGFVRRQAGT
jgi:hypothetical protein